MPVSPRARSGWDQRVKLSFLSFPPTSAGVHRRHRPTGRGREGRASAGRGWAALHRRRASQGQIPQTGAGADDQRCPQRPGHAHGPQEAGDVRWVLLFWIISSTFQRERWKFKSSGLLFFFFFSISMLEEDLRAKKKVALICDFFFSFSLSLSNPLNLFWMTSSRINLNKMKPPPKLTLRVFILCQTHGIFLN